MNNLNPGQQLVDGSTINFLLGMLTNGANGITAFAGGGQASATLLTAGLNQIKTCATDHDSVKLPPAKRSPANGFSVCMVYNNSAHTLDVFPSSGEAIGLVGADTADTIATGKATIYFCAKDGTWAAVRGA